MTLSAPQPLPRPVRRAAVTAISLSVLVGLFSVNEAASLAHPAELKEALLKSPAIGLGDAALTEQLRVAQADAQMAALESMQVGRSLVLWAQALVCAVTLVTAARLLRPAGLPMEGMRRFLGGGLLAVAILRTVDGALWTVVARRIGVAWEKILAQSSQQEGYVEGMMTYALVTATAVMTALMVGAFLWLSAYFRSDKVRQIVAFVDKRQA